MHCVQRRVYLQTFIALLSLLALTVIMAYQLLGHWGVVIALTIAVSKALLIVLYFMHVRYEASLVRVFSIAGFFWLVILLVFLMSDYLTRSEVLAVLISRK